MSYFNVRTLLLTLLCLLVLCSCSTDRADVMGESNQVETIKERINGMYGENRRITGTYDASVAADCHNGTFVGQKEGVVNVWRGIPYAKPPTGDLRWRAPEVPAEDGNVYEAYYFGKSPIQTEWPSEAGSYYPRGEDCLTLNIWTHAVDPAKAGSSSPAKPVMVFFHGGSYGWGGTSDPIYDGHNLTEKFYDIVLVTVEYRLGIMGFIDFSAVEGGKNFTQSGNLGLLDQKCALQWVQKNISAFGGDPDNVTIFGESAGAGSVSLLPLMDGTDGLFRRIIAESGSVALTKEGYDRFKCYALCKENAKIYTEFGSSYTNEDGTGANSIGSEVCGKCITGSPCAFRGF